MMLDFDEMLVKVKNPQIKKYLEESFTSYRVGNYRSAILTIWIAAMFDLVKKFEILVDQREPSALTKWRTLKPKIEDHKNWEMELIESAKAIDMISRYEADTLKGLITTRNRYAHPSFDEIGELFDPTPEEVRYFIRALYDIVLSQPAQLGAYYVKQLLEKIKSPTFFVANLFVDELTIAKDSVIEVINKINKKQVPRLIKDLFKSLHSPVSKEHELNIICFIVNLWDNRIEREVSNAVLASWNIYIEDNQLSPTVAEAILSYPEQLNRLSDKSQKKIEEFLVTNFLKNGKNSASFTSFLSYADVVPLAQYILEVAPQYISLDKVIERSTRYADLFGSKFGFVFGKSIFDRAREVLKTRSGYKVNSVLDALRKCDIWETANNCLLLEEEINFANELIYSLNSNNFATMNLLNFNDRNNTPIKWVKLLLEHWSDEMRVNSIISRSLPAYLEHYLGLVERYNSELSSYARLNEDIEIIEKMIKTNDYAYDSILDLKSNNSLWIFWQNTLIEYSNNCLPTLFSKMLISGFTTNHGA